MDEQGKPDITPVIMGTRWDNVPPTRRHTCYLCKELTYTEGEYPEGSRVLCDACSVSAVKTAEETDTMAVVWDLPTDVLNSLKLAAKQQKVEPEQCIISFLDARAGRELSQIRLYNREDKQIHIIKKQ